MSKVAKFFPGMTPAQALALDLAMEYGPGAIKALDRRTRPARRYITRKLVKRKPYRRVTRPGPSKKKKAFKRGYVVPYGGRRFPKPRKNRRPSKYVKYKIDTTGQLTAANCGWIGIQANGGYDNYLYAAAMSIARAICSRIDFHPSSVDEAFICAGAGTGETIDFMYHFKERDPGTGDVTTEYVTKVYTVGTSKFSNVFVDLQTEIRDNLEYGRTLDFVQISKNPGTGGETVHQHVTSFDLSKAVLEIYVTSITHMQNQSKAPTTGTAGHEDVANRLNIHSQPLQGKLYKFRNAAAVVRPEVGLTSSVFGDEIDVDGIHTATFTTGTPARVLAHPPNAKNVFENCYGSTNVRFTPGENKRHVQKLNFKGTISSFCDLLMGRRGDPLGNTGRRQRAWGKVDWFCIERAIRHNDADMEIAINCERHYSAYCKLVPHSNNVIVYHDNSF